MIYIADTANISELEELYSYFPLAGVTTNPTILKNSGMKLSVAIEKVKQIVGDGSIHVQVMGVTTEEMCTEARKYKEYFNFGDNYFAKIPVTPAGFKAMQILSSEGMGVTATAIFTQQQALVAARSGADYVAPYVSRLDNISSHGIQVVTDIVKNMNDYGLKTKVLAASFKTVAQVHRVSMAGCHAATINHEILTRLTQHPMTDISVTQFLEDGKEIYDVEF
jgi:fructose-6-phosphate aldolase 2